jgi:ABC-type lipoprotein release transport system permease subunit
MNAAITWFRIDLRHRWRSLLVLALLIAFSIATVATAVAGARRGSSAVDRLLDVTFPVTAVALPNDPNFDWEPIAALPEVEAVGKFAVSGFVVDEAPEDDVSTGFPVIGPDIYRTIEKPVVLEGRALDPSRPDEVMVSPLFLEHYGFHIGDTVTIRLYSPEQIDVLDTPDDQGGPPEGPVVDATIVGSIRSLWFSDQESPLGGLTPSPALFDQYPSNFLGTGPTTYVNAMIRLSDGAASIPAFKEDLARISGRNDIDVWDMTAAAAELKDVTSFEARSLLVFAFAALVAALFLVGQALARHVASTISDLEPLRAVGMTPAESRVAATIGSVVAGIAGVLIGISIAFVASNWFPVGTAAWMEPSPGFHADWLVFGVASVVVLVLVIGGSFVAATIALSSTQRQVPPRKSAIASQVARLGMPVPVVVGSRFALEPGSGSTAVPVRPALFGAIFGVLGISAVFTFANGIDASIHDPQRFGQTWDLATYIGFNNQDFAPAEDVMAQIATDADVRAVDNMRLDVAQIGGTAVSVLTLDPLDTPLDVVLTKGSLAAGPGEITLGPRSAEAASLDVGDTVTVVGPDGDIPLTVSGIGFLYPGPHNDYASGGWVTPATYNSMFDGFKFHFVVIDVEEGADPMAVAGRLQSSGIDVFPNSPIPEQRQLLQVQAIPWFLAGFLALLGIAAVGHALATAVRRRRRDLAVLRAVGMTRPQSRVVVVAQATILALIGLAVGIPLGVALGRTVWRYVADITPVYYVPPIALVALALVVPLALLAANLMAIRPSWRAANMRLGEELRSE